MMLQAAEVAVVLSVAAAAVLGEVVVAVLMVAEVGTER
jgi:hypothetical protein